jgi:cation transport ATPase
MHGLVPLTERMADVDDQLTPATGTESEPPTTADAPPAPPAEVQPIETPATPSASSAEEKPKTRGKWRLLLAAVVIIAGLVVLLWRLGWFGGQWDISNWWGFLILIPAVACFVVAWWVWHKKGQGLTWNVVRWIVFALVLVALALVFAFKSDLTEVWPVLAIIVGIGIALSWKG